MCSTVIRWRAVVILWRAIVIGWRAVVTRIGHHIARATSPGERHTRATSSPGVRMLVQHLTPSTPIPHSTASIPESAASIPKSAASIPKSTASIPESTAPAREYASTAPPPSSPSTNRFDHRRVSTVHRMSAELPPHLDAIEERSLRQGVGQLDERYLGAPDVHYFYHSIAAVGAGLDTILLQQQQQQQQRCTINNQAMHYYYYY